MHYFEAINITLSGTRVQVADQTAYDALLNKTPSVIWFMHDPAAAGKALVKFTGPTRANPGALSDTNKTFAVGAGQTVKLSELEIRGEIDTGRNEGFDLRDIWVQGTGVLTVLYSHYYPGLN
jgi:hypothetical protein